MRKKRKSKQRENQRKARKEREQLKKESEERTREMYNTLKFRELKNLRSE